MSADFAIYSAAHINIRFLRGHVHSPCPSFRSYILADCVWLGKDGDILLHTALTCYNTGVKFRHAGFRYT